jgi:hypothetical protein
VIVSVDVDQLAAEVLAEVERHPPRSAERRAAAHLWASLITSPTITAARRAATTFGDDQVQAAAVELLGRLLKEHAHE